MTGIEWTDRRKGMGMISISRRTSPRRVRRCVQLVAPLAVAAAVTGCEMPPDASGATAPGGDVVTSTGFSRSGTVEKHLAYCGSGVVDEYKVQIPASVAETVRAGDSCPAGFPEPLAKDKYPELYAELTGKLPYGGGNRFAACGAWETIDQAEARRLAKECPPLKWGDVDG
ncbi:hypothetical protein [Prauserella endophytica]|uniref:Septum formation-related domain-containing protein n=1 Tax=Prauserella endophytica TaxID=1592324 RepID=A0ABY2RV08_9PSEU|nr:hypothetical protein [Prauserella endophytica]TKG61552.1 hypothetical protein FCN18_33475 [Prauserella endophytica]